MKARAARSHAGFTLVEALIATTIILVVSALACGLAVEAQHVWRGESARVDLHQRGRVVADVLTRALLEAGAGARGGPGRGPLGRLMPAILPRRAGRRGADPGTVFRRDALTVVRALPEAEHGVLQVPLPASGTGIELAPGPGCTLPSCGFVENDTALIVDGLGGYDVFTVIGVAGRSLTLRHHGSGAHPGYPAGTVVLAADVSTFYLDRATRTLRRYDGDAGDFPVMDDVVEMGVEYYAEPLSPVRPRPPDGMANCLYAVDGTYLALAMLPVAGGSHAVVPGNLLTDGPWCGAGSSQYDADLLRLRRVRATVRLQATDPAVRGTDPVRFREPGQARRRDTLVPDVTIVVDVTPRNLRTAW